MANLRPDDDTIAAHVRMLIAQHPDARVTAVDPQTMDYRPDVLSTLGVEAHRSVDGMDLLAEVAEPDQHLMIGHVLRVADEGAVFDVVALADGSYVSAGLFDLQRQLGAFVGVTVPMTFAAAEEADDRRRRPLPARVCHVRIGPLGEVLGHDDETVTMLGWTFETLVGRSALDLVHPEDRVGLMGCFLGAFGSTGGTDRGRGRLRRVDGTWLWAEISFRHLPGSPERELDVEFVDISAEMTAHEELRAREELLDRLTNTLPIGVAQIDHDRSVRFTNNQLGALTGVAGAVTIDEQFATVVPEDRVRLAAAIDRALLHREDHDLEVRLSPGAKTADRICRINLRPLAGQAERGTGAVICAFDITEQAMARAELETRAVLDPLTRTLNRDGLMVALRRFVGESDDGIVDPFTTAPTTVVFVDLDGFKRINDTFGHGEGDRVLRLAVERMQDAVRDQDLVGRIGGDEFVAICPGIGRAVDALAVADRVAALLAEATPGSEYMTLRASVGVAIGVPGDGRNAVQLLADADSAMYESKRAGLGRPVLFGST